MATLDKYIAGALFLILVYLLVANASSANTVLRSLADFNTTAIKALQGRG